MPPRGWITRTHCKDCNVELNIVNCVIHGRARGPLCRECHKKQMKINYQKRKVLGFTRNETLKKYGMTTEDYNKLVELQLGGCAICKRSLEGLYVDHDHLTGRIRGLLCRRCNFALGYLNDDEDLIFNIMEYLKRTTWEKGVA